MSYNTFTPIVTDGLVLYLDAANTKSYPGTGTSWLDLSKNGNNGTLTNGPTFSSSNGGNIVFDGVNDYVQTNLVYSTSLSIDFTVAVWFKVNSLSVSENRMLVSNYQGAPVPFNLYVMNSGVGVFQGYSRNNSSVFVEVNSVSRVDDFNWHYCVYMKSGNTYSVYVDGIFEKSVSATLGSISVTNGLVLGTLNFYYQSFFNGNMSSTLIYNRALTASEVLQNYNATKYRYIG